MKVLAIYRHYWPDTTPHALILRLILERLASRGADVTAYATHPCYSGHRRPRCPRAERLGGVQVRRLAMLPEGRRLSAMRAVNDSYFLARAITHATVRQRYDVVISNSHPPVAAGVCLRIIKRLTGAKTILHLQDIHPEALQALDSGRPSLLLRIARAIDTESCRDADQLVTLSTDMRDTLSRRGVSTRHVALINNCPLVDLAPTTPDLPSCIVDGSATRFLFAGNLGRFQHLEPLIEAATRLSACGDWRLILMGDGRLKARLRESAGALLNNKIFLLDRLPIAAARLAMRVCDYGIVSLSPGVCRHAFPSKTATYLAEGMPVAAIIEPETELAQTLVRRGLGLVSQGHDTNSVVNLLYEAIRRRDEWIPAERRRIAETADELYGATHMLSAWDEIIDRLSPGSLSLHATPQAAA